MKLSSVDDLFLKAAIETAGPVLPEGDPGTRGTTYRVCLNARKPAADCSQNAGTDAVWTIQGGGFGRGGSAAQAASRYFAAGPGASPQVKVEGNTLTLQGDASRRVTRRETSVFVSAAACRAGSSQPASRVPAQQVNLGALASPEVDLSSAKKEDGPFPVVYQAFHYLKPPRAVDLTCTVIKALGDKFDFLAYYSDFRIDNPEAGTSSNGPLGGGPDGGAVTGIGANQRNLASFCTQGRFQWQYIQPVYVGANQMQEYPPEGLQESNPTTLPPTRNSSRNARSTGRSLRMTMRCRRSDMRWATAGRLSFRPRSAARPSDWVRPTGRGVCRPLWLFPISVRWKHRPWGAECGRITSTAPTRNWMTITMCRQQDGRTSTCI